MCECERQDQYANYDCNGFEISGGVFTIQLNGDQQQILNCAK